MEIILLLFYAFIGGICFVQIPNDVPLISKILWSLTWPITILVFWTYALFLLITNSFRRKFIKASNAVAISGAQEELNKAYSFIQNHIELRNWVLCSSYSLVESRLMSDFGLPLNDQADSFIFYTPEYHRTAHDLKKRQRAFLKDSPEYAVSSLAIAAFSILGTTPSFKNRKDLWTKILSLWHEGFHIPDKNTIMRYDAKTGLFWVKS